MRRLLTAIVASLLALPVLSQDAGDRDAGTTDTGQDPVAETAEAAQEGSDDAPEAANEGEAAPEPDAEPPADAGETSGGDEAAAGEAAGDEAAAEDADGAGGPLVVLDEEEGSVIDDQTFEGEDDDFIPTEQIPVDQPIPFPSDI